MTPRSRHAAPPLAFVVFWLAFTSVHAFFMLRGFRHSGALFVLVPFYLLFFGVGFYMAATWWRAAGLRRRFGTPTLPFPPPAAPGQLLQLSVDFDKAWPRDARLEGRLHWVAVGSKGQSGRVLAEAPLSGGAAPGPRGTAWQGAGTVPAAPATTERHRLELVLQPPDSPPGSAWRFELPLQVAATATPRIEAQDIRRLEPALRWIAVALVAGGSWQLYGLVGEGARDPFRLVFPAGFFLMAWLLNDLRETLLAAVGPGGASQAEMRERLRPFLQRCRARVQWFAALAVLAFFASAFDLLGPGGLPGR